MTQITDEMVKACARELFDDTSDYWLGKAREGLTADAARPASAGVGEEVDIRHIEVFCTLLLEPNTELKFVGRTWEGTVLPEARAALLAILSPARAGSKPEGDG